MEALCGDPFSRVPEVPLHPHGQPLLHRGVMVQIFQNALDVVGLRCVKPLAVGEVPARVDLGFRVRRPRHHQRLPGGQAVVDHG